MEDLNIRRNSAKCVVSSRMQSGTAVTQIFTGRQTKTGAGRFLRHSCAPAGGLLAVAQPLATAARPPQRQENTTVAFGKTPL